MTTFEPSDIVRVPFPYTDRPVRQRRPALVIAAGDLQTAHGLLWLAMITSAEHRGWPGDVVISDPGGAGLPAHRLCGQRKSRRSTREMQAGSELCRSANGGRCGSICDSASPASADDDTG